MQNKVPKFLNFLQRSQNWMSVYQNKDLKGLEGISIENKIFSSKTPKETLK